MAKPKLRTGLPRINPDLIQGLLLKAKGLSKDERLMFAVCFARVMLLNGEDMSLFLKPFEDRAVAEPATAED